jgi:tRNA1(Val) A37 N6-methylase TrmN6
MRAWPTNCGPMPASRMAVPITSETTTDAVLGGRLRLRQKRKGHRFGHDAILLAAATAAQAGDRIVELGAGVGAAGLALAARVPGLRLTLVEIDPELAALAAENAVHNGFGEVRVLALDVGAAPDVFGAAGAADGVLMNPPFNDTARQQVSPDRGRSLAHAGPADLLNVWIGTAARLLRAGGTLTLIWRADGLADVLAALEGAFGAVAVMPVYPKPDAPAIRVLVRAQKGGSAPLKTLPGLVLNNVNGTDGNGTPSVAAEAVLRRGEALLLASMPTT